MCTNCTSHKAQTNSRSNFFRARARESVKETHRPKLDPALNLITSDLAQQGLHSGLQMPQAINVDLAKLDQALQLGVVLLPVLLAGLVL